MNMLHNIIAKFFKVVSFKVPDCTYLFWEKPVSYIDISIYAEIDLFCVLVYLKKKKNNNGDSKKLEYLSDGKYIIFSGNHLRELEKTE